MKNNDIFDSNFILKNGIEYSKFGLKLYGDEKWIIHEELTKFQANNPKHIGDVFLHSYDKYYIIENRGIENEFIIKFAIPNTEEFYEYIDIIREWLK